MKSRLQMWKVAVVGRACLRWYRSKQCCDGRKHFFGDAGLVGSLDLGNQFLHVKRKRAGRLGGPVVWL
ncbi:hypothetical protein DM39_1493 [Burkholderia cenocepacia]|uniref:Uncharacterized protein n=1 Tax=Burkholderia cenocepacia TaxID=95486 RepID=A0AAN0RTT2_9BURK|nr:hypothetical protein DM39_1493 [Burkholderia cenocepacia]